MSMRVLAFASQKAGAGKTTLAGHIAVQAQKSGSVAVIDVDPEAHLADWCAKRADQPLRHVHATQAELLQKIDALRGRRHRSRCHRYAAGAQPLHRSRASGR